MGYSRNQVLDSLQNEKFDDIFSTYLLLCEKKNEVSRRHTDLTLADTRQQVCTNVSHSGGCLPF